MIFVQYKSLNLVSPETLQDSLQMSDEVDGGPVLMLVILKLVLISAHS